MKNFKTVDRSALYCGGREKHTMVCMYVREEDVEGVGGWMNGGGVTLFEKMWMS